MTSTTSCRRCGAPYESRTITAMGRDYTISYPTCGCEEKVEEASRKRMEEQAGIPARYAEAQHESAPAIAEAVEAGQSFYIDGTQGSGKTHLAMAVSRTLIAAGFHVRIAIAPALMEALRSRAAEDRSETERLRSCRVLVIDDLGKEAPTPYACERLFDIINDRYNSMRPVIITSNFTRGDIAKRLSEGDTGRSIASRLSEMCQRIHMDGADRRLNHA